jgi:hypothetical protein
MAKVVPSYPAGNMEVLDQLLREDEDIPLPELPPPKRYARATDI